MYYILTRPLYCIQIIILNPRSHPDITDAKADAWKGRVTCPRWCCVGQGPRRDPAVRSPGLPWHTRCAELLRTRVRCTPFTVPGAHPSLSARSVRLTRSLFTEGKYYRASLFEVMIKVKQLSHSLYQVFCQIVWMFHKATHSDLSSLPPDFGV